MWWKLVHDEPVPHEPLQGGRARHEPDQLVPAAGSGEAGDEDDEDDELAAYNRYLAELNASGRPKRW